MSSPTSRTLKFERDQGHTAQVMEHWNPFAKRRIDLFNCIDVVSLTGENIIGIQCTSGSNHSAREKKARETGAIYVWIKSGGVFRVQSWKKNSKNRWVQRTTQAGFHLNEMTFDEI